MCKDFLVTPLEAQVLYVEFSNVQDIFVITKSYLGIFLTFSHFEK